MSAQPEYREHPADALTERDLALLDFEREWAERRGPKDSAIRSHFGVSAARYYQMLYSLIDSPIVLAYDPMLVRRLQRLREARSTARTTRTFRAQPSNEQDRFF